MKESKNPGKEQLFSLIKEGKTASEIAKEYGVKESTVYSWAKDAGLKIPRKKHYRNASNPGKEQLSVLIEEGKTASEIASECGVAKRTIYQWLKNAGLQIPRKKHYRKSRNPGRELLEEIYTNSERTQQEAAAYFGVASSTFDQWCKEESIPKKAAKPSKLPNDCTLRRLYIDEGKTSKEIAGMYGLSAKRVRQVLAEKRIRKAPDGQGGPRESRNPGKEKLQEMLSLGISKKDIMSTYDVSVRTVNKWLKKDNIIWNVGNYGGGTMDINLVTKEDLERMYVKENHTTAELAAIFGIKPQGIRGHLSRMGIHKQASHKGGIKSLAPDRAILWKLYIVDKLTMAQIALQYGVSASTVYRWLKEENITYKTKQAFSI